MAFTPPTSIEYTGDGTTTLYTFPFDYLASDYVEVLIDGEETSAWSFETASSVRLDSAPANGTTIRIQRRTKSDTMLTDFQDASVLREKDLDLGFNQLLNVYQEAFNEADNALGIVRTLSENAESYVEASEQGAIDAQAAKNAAETAESNTLGYRNTTLTYRNEAEGFRDQADSSANAASNAAVIAVNARDAAEDSETNAANSENAAYEWANEEQDVSVSYGGKTGYSAYHYSQLANDSRVAAETARSQAVTAKDLAQSSSTNAGTSASQAENHADDASDSASLAFDHSNYAFDWANFPEDQQLTLDGNTGYSAYHWAKKAESHAGDSDTLDGYHASAFPRKNEHADIVGNWDFGGMVPPTIKSAKIWTEANDGINSGLDADKVHGVDGTRLVDIQRGGFCQCRFWQTTDLGSLALSNDWGIGLELKPALPPNVSEYFENTGTPMNGARPLTFKKTGFYRVHIRFYSFNANINETGNPTGLTLKDIAGDSYLQALVIPSVDIPQEINFTGIILVGGGNRLYIQNDSGVQVNMYTYTGWNGASIEYLGPE